jgi:OmpA-OmpF porin, OOP family
MRRVGIIVALLVCVSSALADNYRYYVGGGGGLATLGGGGFFSYERESTYAFMLGHRLTDRWWFDVEYSHYKFTNDTTADSTGAVGLILNNSPLEFTATRIGGTVTRLLFSSSRRLNLTAGFGGGLMVWKAVDLISNTTYSVSGSREETTDFAASELFLNGTVGLLLRPASRVSLHIGGRMDYFTGAGAEFESGVNDSRDRRLFGVVARLAYHFGGGQTEDWKLQQNAPPKDEDQAAVRRGGRDSDADGVPDDIDLCLNTPKGALVTSNGCPRDSDNDGVPDGLDDCPATSVEAKGRVDVHGCPVDTDFDGFADFMDRCPFNAIGAEVDSVGCPVDSDGDGVPDGLDDCPYSLVGVPVDKYGCIDLTMFSEPMVLNIPYASGAFEVDPYTMEKLRRLAGLLTYVKDIRLDVNGYTDNIGTPAGNKAISERRANRVRDYLTAMGVEAERMKAFGRGEANFVASNDTAEGRAKNRRIEIVFYK